jgi:hypothetical protein
MNIPELEYVANHLTLKECRWLVASLHFVSFKLPALSAEQYDDVPCIKLLVKWNNGKNSWEGKGKTHEDIARRLRQIGRKDLADWLGNTVFHKLAMEVEHVLENPGFVAKDNDKYDFAVFNSNDKTNADEWNTLDTIIYLLLIGVVGTLVFTYWRILVLTFTEEENLTNEVLDTELSRNLLSYDDCNLDKTEEQDTFDENSHISVAEQ